MSRGHQKTNVAISVMTAVAIALMANYLASRHYFRADWTSSGMYTLSAKTEAQVARIESETWIYVLWSKSDPLYVHVAEILKRYQALSKKIHIEALDPDINPEKFKLISEKYGRVRNDESGQTGLETGVIVVNGDDARFVPSSDFQDFGGDMLQEPGDTPLSSFKAEQEITGALVGVLDKTKRTVCFTQGHGEWSFEGDNQSSLVQVRRSLKLDGLYSTTLEIDNTVRIPASCSLVAVVGPTRSFLSEEAAVLERWLKSGGRLLLLLDPLPRESDFQPTGLEKLTFDAGIQLQNDVAVESDPRRLVSNSAVTFIASEFFRHAAVKPLSVSGPLPVVFSSARSLKIGEGSGAVAEILVQTSPMSWGETNLASLQSSADIPQQDDHDSDGPLPLAAVSNVTTADPAHPGRLIVVGDSDFLSEELMIRAQLYNQEFWNGLVGWLTEYREMLTIAPKNPEQVQLTLTEEDSRHILITLALQILLIIALGVFTILSRRK